MTHVDHARQVLASSFAAFAALADTAIGPKQREFATRNAGHCLWALGVDEACGFHAVPPVGQTIEGTIIEKTDSEASDHV